MPQNRFSRSSKPADLPTKPYSTKEASATAANKDPNSSNRSNTNSSSWQRSQGAFSSKAKKDYLKWKRQQKAAAASATDSDSDRNPAEPHTTRKPSSQPCATVGHSSSRTAAGTTAVAVSATLAAAAADDDDPSQPLQYRPLVAVPAQPFTAAAAAAATATSSHNSTSTGESGDLQPSTADAGASTPVPAIAALPRAAATAAPTQKAASISPSSDDIVYMPRLAPHEVGFTVEGFELDMPTRPQWKGLVNSAEELHALEEQHFAAWQDALLHKAGLGADAQQQQQHNSSRAGGVGRLSFYEGRLEFWRQLWRTLEMSDVVLMIVDARNPLLHFSHALYRHITQHHKLPLIVLLNKCDLIPAAAAAAWQQWLQQQLPGVVVVPVSAAEGQAAAAAKAISDEVLKVDVQRAGRIVKVQDFVGLSADEILQASHTRNTHAKRQVQQHNATAAAAAADQGAFAVYGDHSDQQHIIDDHAGDDHDGDHDDGDDHGSIGSYESDDDDYDASWSLKPAKLAKKAGKKAGRSRTAKQKQQQQQQQKQRQKQQQQDPDRVEDSDLDEESLAWTARIESLTLERRLSSNANPNARSYNAAAAADNADNATQGPAAAAAAGSSSSLWNVDDRPVVVGLLGEPNVGKSSTLNSLLGAHRVAVSCHPGRTKHYQTHFMTDRLVLCDCPGIVFPRLDVSMPMQVLFGSYPIASCRQPYAVVRYLAEASWPRVHTKIGLKKIPDNSDKAAAAFEGGLATAASSSSGETFSDSWSPFELCEALAEKRRWVLPRSGRLDTYRAANWLLRAALGGREGLGLAFMPPNA